MNQKLKEFIKNLEDYMETKIKKVCKIYGPYEVEIKDKKMRLTKVQGEFVDKCAAALLNEHWDWMLARTGDFLKFKRSPKLKKVFDSMEKILDEEIDTIRLVPGPFELQITDENGNVTICSHQFGLNCDKLLTPAMRYEIIDLK